MATIQKACEGAGKTWSSSNGKAGICSGAAVDVGFDANVRVDFCTERACAVTLVYQPKSEWISTFGGLKDKLAEKYSAPATVYAAIPDSCRKEAQFLECMESQELRLKFRWQWPGKQKIELSIGKPENGAGAVAIRVKYINPQQKLRANVDAL